MEAGLGVGAGLGMGAGLGVGAGPGMGAGLGVGAVPVEGARAGALTCSGEGILNVWHCWSLRGEAGSLARKEKRQEEGSQVA